MNIIINNKYKIIEEIGSGSFGKIYKGQNIRTSEYVAVKVESLNGVTKLLKNESIIYQYLTKIPGIPAVKWFGKDNNYYYMVISLLGMSLNTLKHSTSVTLKLALEIGIKLLNLIEKVHDAGLVHRDIKPDNFLLDCNNSIEKIYLIDFGMCKTIALEEKPTHGFIGSLNYSSINAHKFVELSMRDDVESILYILIYFSMGFLPWENSPSDKITELKTNIIYDVRVHYILRSSIKYIRGLGFKERPDYDLIIKSFQNTIEKL